MSPLQTVLDALTNDGTHEDGCPDSNYCFNTECDYCQPIHAMRELNAIAVVKRMMQAEPVIEVVRMPDHWKDRFFYADSRSYISESSISKLPIGTKLYAHPAPQAVPASKVDRMRVFDDAEAAMRRNPELSWRDAIADQFELAYGITNGKK
jgi:hypothetical protein